MLSAQNSPPTTPHLFFDFLTTSLTCVQQLYNRKNTVCSRRTPQRELSARPNFQSTLLVRCLAIGENPLAKKIRIPSANVKKTQPSHEEDTQHAICVEARHNTACADPFCSVPAATHTKYVISINTHMVKKTLNRVALKLNRHPLMQHARPHQLTARETEKSPPSLNQHLPMLAKIHAHP